MTQKLSLQPSPLYLRVVKPLSCPHLGRKHPAKGPGTREKEKSVQGLSQVSIPHEMGIRDDHATCQNKSPKGKISLQSRTAVCVTSILWQFHWLLPLSLTHSLFVTHPPPIFPQASTFHRSPGQHLGLSVCVWRGKAGSLHINVLLRTKNTGGEQCLPMLRASFQFLLPFYPGTGCLPFQWTTQALLTRALLPISVTTLFFIFLPFLTSFPDSSLRSRKVMTSNVQFLL